jgi:Uncharacterised nucleotidyltransferase
VVEALRGEPAPWPAASARLADAVLDLAAADGVAPLLATTRAAASWPDAVRTALRDALRLEAAIEAVRRDELSRMTAALHSAGVRALLLKGARLAYTVYPRPWLRPRVDTDLLVAARERSTADQVLRDLGYAPHTHFDGELVTHQFQYERRTAAGLELVDLHWKIANPHAFADVFRVDELEQDAIAIDGLGACARGPSDVHSLLLACLHTVAHHAGSERLVWLYDIHLLASRLSEAEREEGAALARDRGLAAVCGWAMQRARRRFATPVPDGWLEERRHADAHAEPTAAFLRRDRTKTDVLVSDLRALPGWRDRMRLVREHLFPPAAYVRQAYGVSSGGLLPLLYAHRILRGVGRWFRP